MASVRFKHKHANPLEYCLPYNKHSVNSIFIILVFEETEMQVAGVGVPVGAAQGKAVLPLYGRVGWVDAS